MMAGAAMIASGSASAAMVSISGISDSNAGNFSGASVADVNATESLVTIGLDAFTASASGTSVYGNAFDTLQLTISAGPGFRITGVSYSETVTSSLDAGAIGIAVGSMVIAGIDTLGFNSQLTEMVPEKTLTATADFASGLESISVALTDSLFVIDTNMDLNGSSVTKSAASLLVTVAPIPVPAPLVLLGSALLGLVVVGRRKLA